MKAIEEMAELIDALAKYKLTHAKSNVCSEIADVQIMMRQLSIIFGEDKVVAVIEYKLKRLETRIKEKENES